MIVKLAALRQDPETVDIQRTGPPRGGVTAIVVREAAGGWYVVTGLWLVEALRAAGIEEVDVDVLQGVTPGRVADLQLAEAYRMGRADPVSFGLAIDAHRRRHQLSYSQLAERT